jgi:8-oxo-dGTP pyrophosphatase MutT (NUDIX family)
VAIRPIAICVVRHEDRILVFEGYDRVKHETFYRPFGGGIEFGEYSEDTVVREMREELGAEISPPRFVSVIESVFELNGNPRHEIVVVYEADLLNRALYQRPSIPAQEADGSPMVTRWMPLDHFREGRAPLHPTGLLDLLENPSPSEGEG